MYRSGKVQHFMMNVELKLVPFMAHLFVVRSATRTSLKLVMFRKIYTSAQTHGTLYTLDPDLNVKSNSVNTNTQTVLFKIPTFSE